jgi:hypothetical protein
MKAKVLQFPVKAVQAKKLPKASQTEIAKALRDWEELRREVVFQSAKQFYLGMITEEDVHARLKALYSKK